MVLWRWWWLGSGPCRYGCRRQEVVHSLGSLIADMRSKRWPNCYPVACWWRRSELFVSWRDGWKEGINGQLGREQVTLHCFRSARPPRAVVDSYIGSSRLAGKWHWALMRARALRAVSRQLGSGAGVVASSAVQRRPAARGPQIHFNRQRINQQQGRVPQRCGQGLLKAACAPRGHQASSRAGLGGRQNRCAQAGSIKVAVAGLHGLRRPLLPGAQRVAGVSASA